MAANLTLKPGEVFGPYKVIRLLGSGGMGEVYQAEEVAIGRHIALKVINEKGLESDEMVQRFLGEAKALARLNHPAVVSLYSFGQIGKAYYMAMEYIQGTGLDDFIKKSPYGIEETLAVFRQLLDGMMAAHQQGIIHRDLKPQNIIITRDKTVKIIDFGIAKLTTDQDGFKTATGMFLGTLNYLAPETAKGFPPTQQTDVYGLGLILYEMLAGRVPFLGKNSFDTLELIRNKPVEFPKKIDVLLPDNVKALVFRMTAKSLAERYAAVGQVIEDFEKISLEDLPAELKVQSVRSRKVTNLEAVQERLKQAGFEDPEIRMIINMACDIQAELDFDPNATMKVSEQEEIEVSEKAIKEARERFTFIRSDLSVKRAESRQTKARTQVRQQKQDTNFVSTAVLIAVMILMGGGIFWRTILAKLASQPAPQAQTTSAPQTKSAPNIAGEARPGTARQPANNLDDRGYDPSGKPMEATLPRFQVGEVFEYVEKTLAPGGQKVLSAVKIKWTVTQVVGDDVTAVSDQGAYRTAKRNPFVGATQMLNSQIGPDFTELKLGDLRAPFPLETGKVATYELAGKTLDGHTQWRRKLRCEVAGYERVAVKAGRFWTYKVICNSDDNSVAPEIMFYSPEMKAVVSRAAGAKATELSFYQPPDNGQ